MKKKKLITAEFLKIISKFKENVPCNIKKILSNISN